MKLLVVAAWSCIFAVATLLAQSDRGALNGTVVDPVNAVIPGAKISLKNLDTGAQYQSTTTDTGNYTIPSLPSGRYVLSVEAAGFSTFIQQGITIQVAQDSRQDVTLTVGSQTDSVTVNADAPLLKTEGAQQSLVITSAQEDALPLPRVRMRNPLDFSTFAPGVTGTGGNPGASSISVNGSAPTTYKVLVDGQDITSSIDPSHFLEQQPSVDALEEFTLQTSNYAAEFGQVAGGLFNLTSKSGTNHYHGTAYIYPRNEWLNAGRPDTNDGQNRHIKPRVRNYNYGASGGGPVYIPKVYNGRNRTFFYASLEKYLVRGTNRGSYTTVPITAYRNGDFSAALGTKSLGTDPLGRTILQNMIYDPKSQQTVNGQIVRSPFPNNVIPNNSLYMDPVAQNIQKLLPLPNAGRESLLVNNYEVVNNPNEDRDIPSIKIDHNIGVKSHLSFFFSSYGSSSLSNADAFVAPISTTRQRHIRSYTYRFTYDYTVTPTLLLHAGAGYVRWTNHDVGLPADFAYPAASAPPAGIGLTGGLTTGFPNIAIGTGSANTGGMGTIGVGNGSLQYDDKPTGVLSGTYVRGNHSYKAGFEWRRDIWAVNDIMSPLGKYSFSTNQTALPYLNTTSIGGSTIGFPYASFLLGAVNSASISNFSDPRWKKNAYGVYIQDTWRITRKLTLDYGLRWDYQQGATEEHYRESMFGPTIANPSAGGLLGATVYEGYGQGRCNCQFTSTYPFAIGPRLGLAYQLNSKTVVRGGWAISFGNPNNYNYIGASVGVGYNTLTFTSSNFGDPGAVLKTGLVYNMADLNKISLDPGIRPSAGQINNPSNLQDRNAGRPSRIDQWNISLQRQVTGNLVVEAAYVGNRAVWLEANSLVDLNALTPQRIASFGLNINNAADRTLLNSPLSSAAAAARGFNKLPYAGYPTGQTVAQSLRPYPQFGTIGTMWSPLGNGWYDGLQTKLTKRFSHGLNASSAFTWEKGLSTQGPVNDVFNRPNQKELAPQTLPFMFINAISYRLPGYGPSRLIRQAIGGWEIGAYLRYMSGSLIAAPSAQNNLNLYLFRGTYANRVPGQPLYLTNINGPIDPNKQFVLNPAAWSDPAQGQWGLSSVYFNDYRSRRSPEEDVNFGRVFAIKEAMSIEVRVEFFNIFNRTALPGPSTGNALAPQVSTAAGVPSSGFGFIQTSGGLGGSRNGQFLARFRF